jgi:hypothetical protein
VKKDGKWDFLILAAFLGLVLVFFFRFLTADQIFAFKDLSRYFYPLRYLMAEQVKAGHLPLWNPYIFCGFPLLAALQTGFFYPLSLIYYLLPFNLAFNYYIILHYFLAASFMYFLLRHYSLSRAASFLGGIVFAFSGYLLSVSNMNTSLSSVIWLPLIFLFFDRLIKKNNSTYARGVMILGILLAIQFLGGEPTIIYVTLFFLIAYAGVFSGSLRSFMKNMGSLIFAGLIALGLVAVQLLPFLELAKLSDRVVRTSYEVVTFRSFPPREILTFIFPYFFGNPSQFGGYSETLLGKTYQDWLISPYLGILPLVLIFLSLKKNRSLSLFLSVAAAVALVLSFGKYTPIYRLAYLVPGISMIRYPVKYLFLVTFCMTILASFGFEALLGFFDEQKHKLLKVLKFVLPVFFVMLAVFVLSYFFRLQIFNFFAQKYSNQIPAYFFDQLARIIEFNLTSFLFVALYLFAFILLLWGAYGAGIKKTVFSSLLILLIAADLFANGYPIAIAASANVFNKIPENFQILKKEKGLYRFFYTPELEDENRLVYGDSYNTALLWAKDNFASNWHIPYHFYDFYGYESIKPMGLFKFYHQSFKKDKIRENFKFLSLFNVKYIASLDKLDIPHLKLLRHKRKHGLDLYLYENSKVLPRAYILGAKNKPELVKAKAEIIKYLPSEIMVFAELKEKGYLFLSEAYFPGWKVFVDGAEGKIVKANNFFRGVKLNPGWHEVKFVYDPLSFKLGAMISLLTLFGLIAGFFVFRR